MTLNDALEAFRKDISAFLSSGVVHRQEGTTIASLQANDPIGDPLLGDAYLAEVLKLHKIAQESLGRQALTEDLVLTTSRGLLLARPLHDSDYIWSLVVGPDANVALTRAVMRRHHEQIVSALP